MPKYNPLTLNPHRIYEGIFIIDGVPHVAYRQRERDDRSHYYDILTLVAFEEDKVEA